MKGARFPLVSAHFPLAARIILTHPRPKKAMTPPAEQHNRRVWDSMVRNKGRFTQPAKDEDFVDPLKTVDGIGWLGGDIRGKQVLCLAAGGGRQSAL